MGKKIKQIDINQALEITRNGGKVYVITFAGKPILKSFNKLAVGDVLSDKSEYMFVVFEEVANEK